MIAKEIIGTAIINGERIQIFDDNTWKFTGNNRSSDEDCDLIKHELYFCNNLSWIKVPNVQDPITAQYNVNDRTYSMFIVERMGTSDGVSRDIMADVALENAANAAGVNVSDIPQHYVRDERVNGYDYLTIAYSAALSGMQFTFINNIFVLENLTVQATIYTLGNEVSDSLLENNANLVKAMDFR